MYYTVKQFCDRLDKHGPANMADGNIFLDGVKIPHADDDDDMFLLNAPITEEEVIKTIKSLSN